MISVKRCNILVVVSREKRSQTYYSGTYRRWRLAKFRSTARKSRWGENLHLSHSVVLIHKW